MASGRRTNICWLMGLCLLFQEYPECHARLEPVLTRIRREINPRELANNAGIVSEVRLAREHGVLWTTRIMLGGQDFTVILDSGSSDLWLASVKCRTRPCLARRRFDPAKSNSFSTVGGNQSSIDIIYGGDVQVRGVAARADLRIGDFTIDSQPFLLANEITGSALNMIQADGVLGVAWKYISRLKEPNFFEQVVEAKQLRERVFSIAPSPNRLSGRLTFGSAGQGYQPSEFKNASLIELGLWKFQLEGVHLEKSGVRGNTPPLLEVCTGHVRCKAIPDSGSPMIIGHAAEIKRMNAILGAQPLGNGVFKFPNCAMVARLPNLVIRINERDKLVLTLAMYTLKEAGDCLSGLAMAPGAGFSFWILGTRFLDNFNTLYDHENRRLGFASLHT